VDALDPLDASTADRVCSRCDPGPCIESCDPARYDDGGTGACAPHWLHGDACVGGQVFFPCGLPAPLQGSANCPALCMGSDQFNGCRTLSADGGIGPTVGGGGPADAGDASDGGDLPVVIDCYVDCTGRRPSNLLEETPRCARTIGEVLASAAYLEAASVVAFVDLAAQLEAYGAPATLVRALRRAARDEVRHARDITALARARGAEPDTVRLETTGPRSLVAIAIENACEGCVRETWGAACAVAQSKRATDPEIRQAMRAIARDELAHASLS
jgi:rubrerythrin